MQNLVWLEILVLKMQMETIFINGDDLIESNLLETLNKYLFNKKYDIIPYDSLNCYSNDKIVSVETKNEVREYKNDEILNYVLPHMRYEIKAASRFYSSAWNKGYNLELIKNINFKVLSKKSIYLKIIFLTYYYINLINILNLS